MNRIRIGRPGVRSERPRPGALSPDRPDPDIGRATAARADRACPVPSHERHRQGVTWGASIGVAGPRAVAGVRLPLKLMHFAVRLLQAGRRGVRHAHPAGYHLSWLN
jgi:hypothetical protein